MNESVFQTGRWRRVRGWPSRLLASVWIWGHVQFFTSSNHAHVICNPFFRRSFASFKEEAEDLGCVSTAFFDERKTRMRCDCGPLLLRNRFDSPREKLYFPWSIQFWQPLEPSDRPPTFWTIHSYVEVIFVVDRFNVQTFNHRKQKSSTVFITLNTFPLIPWTHLSQLRCINARVNPLSSSSLSPTLVRLLSPAYLAQSSGWWGYGYGS